MKIRTWCPECGPGVPVDEDGCCVTCGNGACGSGADQALKALDEVVQIRRRAIRELQDEYLKGTPPETKLCYLHKNAIIIVGTPADDEEHDCDQMGCGWEHVLERIDITSLRQTGKTAQQ